MKRKNEQSTRELMGTKELSDYSIRTYRKDELVYFLIQLVFFAALRIFPPPL